jgi:hypothetical protein
MKSLWDKASEISSKAKTMANDYLQKEPDRKPNEYIDQINKLQSEIEKFQKDSLKLYESKIKQLCNSIEEKDMKIHLLKKNLATQEDQTTKNDKKELKEKNAENVNKIVHEIKRILTIDFELIQENELETNIKEEDNNKNLVESSNVYDINAEPSEENIENVESKNEDDKKTEPCKQNLENVGSSIEEDKKLELGEEKLKEDKLLKWNNLLNSKSEEVVKLINSKIESYTESNDKYINENTNLKRDLESMVEEKLKNKLEYNTKINELTTLLERSNKIEEEKHKLKSDLDKAKRHIEQFEKNKNEIQINDVQAKQLNILQQELKESIKSQQTLKENIETLENNSKEYKNENDKLQNKIKTLNNLYEEVLKENNNLKEKIKSINQQSEIFKVENNELIEKLNQKIDENRTLTDRVSIFVEREKPSLLSRVNEYEEAKKIHLKTLENLADKVIEIDKLKNSYSSLEEFIEMLKSEREHISLGYKNQINELTNENKKLKELFNQKEDKNRQEEINEINLMKEEIEKRIIDSDFLSIRD